MHRTRLRQVLRRWQRWRKIVLAPVLAAIERVFDTLTRRNGWWRVCYRGPACNETHLQLLCAAYDLRRAAGNTAP